MRKKRYETLHLPCVISIKKHVADTSMQLDDRSSQGEIRELVTKKKIYRIPIITRDATGALEPSSINALHALSQLTRNNGRLPH